MVDVQDSDAHPHKRTAIPQLLNPVSSSPTKRQEGHPYATYQSSSQHPGPSPPVRSDLSHPDPPPTGRQTYNLRAAQWEPKDSPPSTAHYASSPETTNGSVRERSASYPTSDSGPRSNEGTGYRAMASFNPSPFYHPPSVSNSPSPAPYMLQQLQAPFYHNGRTGEHSDKFELNYYSSIV